MYSTRSVVIIVYYHIILYNDPYFFYFDVGGRLRLAEYVNCCGCVDFFRYNALMNGFWLRNKKFYCRPNYLFSYTYDFSNE